MAFESGWPPKPDAQRSDRLEALRRDEVQPGATFVLGSEENPVDTGTISGGVRATNPASVQIHFTTINGGIKVHGGSGPFGGPFDITWNAIEDNRINGGATVEGYDGFWMGFIRNHVNGSVNLNDNTLVDPDGNVARVFPKVKPLEHDDLVLGALKELAA